MKVNEIKREFEKQLAVTLISMVLITLSVVAWLSALFVFDSVILYSISITATIIFFVPYGKAITKITQ